MNTVPKRSGLLLRYFLLSFFSLFFSFLILPSFVFSQTPTAQISNYLSQTSLLFQPATGTYNINDTFDVDIILDTGTTPVYGAKIIATYDPAFSQPVDNTVAPLMKDTNWRSPDFNRVNRGQIILDYGKNQPAFTGNSAIGRITFRALKPGQAQMNIVFYQQFDNTTPNVSTVYGKRDGINISNVLTDVNNAIYFISDQNSCSQEGGPCGVGFAGPSHPLGTCCNGLTCIESGNPDQGGTCQNNCLQPPPCLNGIRQTNGTILYCDPQPGIIYCPIPTTLPPIDCPTHQFGDANCDGNINDADYRIWEYESQFPDLPYKRADFHSDGVEDLIDFEIWRRNTQGTDICTNSDNTVSMAYDEAKQIAENSICTSEGIIRDEGREFCNRNSGTWWLPFASLSNSKPGCSPACVVNINTKQAEINWRCTGLITPIP